MTTDSEKSFAYVGTRTDGQSEGIYVFRTEGSSGALTPAADPATAKNPSFLAIHPNCTHLYAVNEVEDAGGEATGAVSAFSIDPQSGALSYVNWQPSLGTGPCHLTVDQTGSFVLVANYAGGTVSMLPIGDGGRLGEATDSVRHEGQSVNKARQDRPHPHSINLDAASRYAFVPDLGIDRVFVYRLDRASGKLVPNEKPWAQVSPGAGPRHFAFHPMGTYAYVINELDSTVTAFGYEQASGELTEIQTVSTLPADFDGVTTCADVHVAQSGRFLYGSNRGHDSIAIFAIDEGTGRLTPMGHEPTRGKIPRNFAIDPSGELMLVANQDSDTIVAFRIDRTTGELDRTGEVTQVPSPVCVKLLPMRS